MACIWLRCVRENEKAWSWYEREGFVFEKEQVEPLVAELDALGLSACREIEHIDLRMLVALPFGGECDPGRVRRPLEGAFARLVA